jgi:hypothetical protein
LLFDLRYNTDLCQEMAESVVVCTIDQG